MMRDCGWYLGHPQRFVLVHVQLSRDRPYVQGLADSNLYPYIRVVRKVDTTYLPDCRHVACMASRQCFYG